MATRIPRATLTIKEAAQILGRDEDALRTQIRRTGMVTATIKAIELPKAIRGEKSKWLVPAAPLREALCLGEDEFDRHTTQ